MVKTDVIKMLIVVSYVIIDITESASRNNKPDIGHNRENSKFMKKILVFLFTIV